MEYRTEIRPGVDPDKPCIYMWSWPGYAYFGKSADMRRREFEYNNNLRKMEEGKPYRKSNPDGWRAIHRGLRLAGKMQEARAKGYEIVLTLLQNVDDPAERHATERAYVDHARQQADVNVLNG
jgi:hypothetical protein